MPTYEYACRACGEHLEVVQSFKDDALTECPSCAGELRKVFSAAGIIFKGSGWHIKDYGGNAATSTTASSDSTSTTSGSSDAAASTSTTSTDKPAASTSKSTSPKATSSDTSAA